MESEDVIPLPELGSEKDEVKESIPEINEADVEEGQFISTTEIDEAAVTGSPSLRDEVDVKKADDTQISGDISAPFGNDCLNDADVEEGQLIDMDVEENGVASVSVLHDNVVIDARVVESNVEADNLPLENGCLTEVTELLAANVASTSGVKRPRTTFHEQQPSVQVKYYGLSRESKHKLEELLREWSEWHARNSSQRQDKHGVLETGEETYFPALDIGTGKNSAVTFWIENEIRKPEDTDVIPVEDASVPLYDRGFSLGSYSADGLSNLDGGSEFLDAPRCFNCSSYSHSLRECPKPRNNEAVNNSRNQLKSKRNQAAGMRNPSRYYQDTPAGKYEGLRPGTLDAETRRLLGLGESDPPPWLNRMREIGYPPGYLEPDDENLPSGITIFAGEEIKVDKEDGEILEPEQHGDVPKKMSVKYPGVNAPIPDNADEKAWAARPSNPDRHGNGDNGRSNRTSDFNPRGRFREQNNQDFKDDDPLGFDRPSRYVSRYSDHDFNSTSRSWRDDDSRPRSPNNGRSMGERGRNDPLETEESLAYRLYSSFSYSSERRDSDHNDGLDVSKGDRADYTQRSRDRDDRHRRHRER